LRIRIAQVISSALSWLIAFGISIVIPRYSGRSYTIARIANSGGSRESSVTVASVVRSTTYVVVVVGYRHAKVLSSWQALSRSETVRNAVAIVGNNIRACTVAWVGVTAITRERIQALACSIIAGSIRISSAERNTVSIALARSSWRRCSGVGDGDVRLLVWRRISNISSVYIEFHKVVVPAGSCIVVLNEIQVSSNSKDSINFCSDIHGDSGEAWIVCGRLLRVQCRGNSWWLIIVAGTRNMSSIHGTGNNVTTSLGVDCSFIEGGGSNSGSSGDT